MYLTAPQISALAQLLLQKGNWKGGQLVPSWWIEEMGKPRVEIPGDEKKALTHYAYHIKAGKEIFAAEGAFGQYLICFRDLPVAIGITAGAREYFAADICLKYILGHKPPFCIRLHISPACCFCNGTADKRYRLLL